MDLYVNLIIIKVYLNFAYLNRVKNTYLDNEAKNGYLYPNNYLLKSWILIYYNYFYIFGIVAMLKIIFLVFFLIVFTINCVIKIIFFQNFSIDYCIFINNQKNLDIYYQVLNLICLHFLNSKNLLVFDNLYFKIIFFNVL